MTSLFSDYLRLDDHKDFCSFIVELIMLCVFLTVKGFGSEEGTCIHIILYRCVYTHAYMNANIQTNTSTYIYAHVYVHANMHTYICICIQFL